MKMNKNAIVTELDNGFIIDSETGEILYDIDKVNDMINDNYTTDEDGNEIVLDDAPYYFEFKGQDITNPFMDSSYRFEVDPVEYYGDAFLNSCFCKVDNKDSKNNTEKDASAESIKVVVSKEFEDSMMEKFLKDNDESTVNEEDVKEEITAAVQEYIDRRTSSIAEFVQEYLESTQSGRD